MTPSPSAAVGAEAVRPRMNSTLTRRSTTAEGAAVTSIRNGRSSDPSLRAAHLSLHSSRQVMPDGEAIAFCRSVSSFGCHWHPRRGKVQGDEQPGGPASVQKGRHNALLDDEDRKG